MQPSDPKGVIIISFKMIYLLLDSEVKCLWCNTVLNEWEYGDQVMARHRSANPDCPFIRNISDNVPLLANASNNEAHQMNSSGTNPSSQMQGIIQGKP